MTNEHSIRVVSAPVRTRVIVSADAPRRVELSVFCRKRSQSTALETCTACANLASVPHRPEAPNAEVFCWEDFTEPSLERTHVDVAEQACRTTVGELLPARVMCVRSDITLQALSMLFWDPATRALAVVDRDGKLLGTVSYEDILSTSTVAGALRPLTYSLPETAPVSFAIFLMSSERVPSLPIVTAEGAVAGMLYWTDVLGWTARSLGYESGASKTAPAAFEVALGT